MAGTSTHYLSTLLLFSIVTLALEASGRKVIVFKLHLNTNQAHLVSEALGRIFLFLFQFDLITNQKYLASEASACKVLVFYISLNANQTNLAPAASG